MSTDETNNVQHPEEETAPGGARRAPKRPREEATAPATPELKTHEDWATAKGFLPERITRDGKNVIINPIPEDRAGAWHLTSSDALPTLVNPETWKYTAARNRAGWVIGKMVTEAEFDREVAFHETVVCR